jgi:hypothetical protein
MTDNPYHNQHIADFTQCMEHAINASNNYNDQQFSNILAILEEMNQLLPAWKTQSSTHHQGRQSAPRWKPRSM